MALGPNAAGRNAPRVRHLELALYTDIGRWANVSSRLSMYHASPATTPLTVPLEMMSLEQEQQTRKELFVVVQHPEQVSRVSMRKVLPGQPCARSSNSDGRACEGMGDAGKIGVILATVMVVNDGEGTRPKGAGSSVCRLLLLFTAHHVAS